MSPEPGVIDLGEYRHGAGAEHDPDQGTGARPPGWGWWRAHRPDPVPRPGPGRRGRLSLVLVALLLAAPAGATVPDRLPLAHLWTVPDSADSTVAVGEHTLYVAVGGEAGALTAYRLSDGAVRWTAPLRGDEGWALVRLVGGVPVVTLDAPAGNVTAGFDPASGRQRWSHPGWVDTAATGGRVVLAREGDDGSWTGELVGVDAVTGRVDWSIRIPTDERLLPSGELLYEIGMETGPDTATPAHLASVGRDGRLTSYDLATGEAVSVELGIRFEERYPDLFDPGAFRDFSGPFEVRPGLARPRTEHGLVVLPDPDGAAAAYDAAGLGVRWRRTGVVWAAPCGPVVCAATRGGARLAGQDPVTGSVRWSLDCGPELAPQVRCYLLAEPLAAGGPVLVSRAELDGEEIRVSDSVVDPATGEQAIGSGQWRLLGPAEHGGWLFSRYDGGYRPDSAQAPERTWLARVRPDPLRFEVLGPVPSPYCLPAAGYVLCRVSAEDSRIEVWRVR